MKRSALVFAFALAASCAEPPPPEPARSETALATTECADASCYECEGPNAWQTAHQSLLDFVDSLKSLVTSPFQCAKGILVGVGEAFRFVFLGDLGTPEGDEQLREYGRACANTAGIAVGLLLPEVMAAVLAADLVAGAVDCADACASSSCRECVETCNDLLRHGLQVLYWAGLGKGLEKTLERFPLLDKLGYPVRPQRCFAAGTAVPTPAGDRPIEELAPGDLVLAWDPASDAVSWKAVSRVIVTPAEPIALLHLADGTSFESIEVTPRHPFFTEVGWVEARELDAGARVRSAHGGWLTVAGVVSLDRRATVYNLEVEDHHTYFVGRLAALVHNENCLPGPRAVPDEIALGRSSDLAHRSGVPGGVFAEGGWPMTLYGRLPDGTYFQYQGWEAARPIPRGGKPIEAKDQFGIMFYHLSQAVTGAINFIVPRSDPINPRYVHEMIAELERGAKPGEGWGFGHGNPYPWTEGELAILLYHQRHGNLRAPIRWVDESNQPVPQPVFYPQKRAPATRTRPSASSPWLSP